MRAETMNLKKYKKALTVGLCIATASLLLLAIAALALFGIGRSLTDTAAASRFARGDLPYTQISLYFSRDANISSTQMQYTVADIEQQLTTDSYAAPNDNARVTLQAYSAETTAYCVGEKGSATARMICTGGDFFYFHPIDITAGWYYGNKELMETVVVLDEALAWQLFGALDVSGMTVTVGGVTCTVVGVTSGPSGKKEANEYGESPTAYIPFSLGERLDGNLPIEACDVLLPNPVTDYGKNLVKEAFGIEDETDGRGDSRAVTSVLIENTERYSPLRVIRSLKDKNSRITRTDTIVYPYWENAARLADNRAYFFGILLIFSAIFPIFYVFVWIVLLFNRKEYWLKKGVRLVADGAKSAKSAIRERKQKKKQKTAQDSNETDTF